VSECNPVSAIIPHVSMIHAHPSILSQSQKYRYCTLEGLEGLEAFLLWL